MLILFFLSLFGHEYTNANDDLSGYELLYTEILSDLLIHSKLTRKQNQ